MSLQNLLIDDEKNQLSQNLLIDDEKNEILSQNLLINGDQKNQLVSQNLLIDNEKNETLSQNLLINGDQKNKIFSQNNNLSKEKMINLEQIKIAPVCYLNYYKKESKLFEPYSSLDELFIRLYNLPLKKYSSPFKDSHIGVFYLNYLQILIYLTQNELKDLFDNYKLLDVIIFSTISKNDIDYVDDMRFRFRLIERNNIENYAKYNYYIDLLDIKLSEMSHYNREFKGKEQIFEFPPVLNNFILYPYLSMVFTLRPNSIQQIKQEEQIIIQEEQNIIQKEQIIIQEEQNIIQEQQNIIQEQQNIIQEQQIIIQEEQNIIQQSIIQEKQEEQIIIQEEQNIIQEEKNIIQEEQEEQFVCLLRSCESFFFNEIYSIN